MSLSPSPSDPGKPPLKALLLPLGVFFLIGLSIVIGIRPGADQDYSPVDSFPPLAEGEEAILFGGDVLWNRDYRRYTKKHGLDYPTRKILPLIASARAVAFVANHEGPITGRKKKCPPAKNWNYRSRPRNLEVLPQVGFTHLSLANNHALDRCWGGLRDTLKSLTKVGVLPFGAGEDLQQAQLPAVIRAGGARVAISGSMEPWKRYREAGWGATNKRGGLALADKKNIPHLVDVARTEADIVVAFPHWGANYRPVNRSQRRIASRFAEVGVDAIIGHHGHAAQGCGHIGEVPVLWGLGNLFFGTPGRFGHDKMQPGYGLLARMVIREGEIQRFELVPIMLNNRLVKFQPRLCTVEESRRVLRSLASRGGSSIDFVGGVGILPARPAK